MAKSLPKIGLFISELNRRRVFRAAVWYGAAGFAVIELTSNIFPILEFPDWTNKAVLAAVAAGAPIALLLSWAFDFTPHGVRRTEARSAVLHAPVSDKSLAVLPFDNLSNLPENEYFSDGITEDVIAAVARLRDLKVISRTSVMQYKKTRQPVRTIAAELGVAHVLEGSVRRSGARVRISAQLIDARTDRHLWAETYDREIEDIFAIQSDVAQRIAASLDAELTAGDRVRLDRGPTGQIDAYEAYLQARYHWGLRTGQSLHMAIEQLERAIELDASFALAWASLAECKVTLATYGEAAPADVMPQARAAAERALELDPRLAQAFTALGAISAYFDWNWDAAQTYYRSAIAADDHYSTAHHWYANTLMVLGRFDEARAALERARELDPLSAAVLTNLGILAHFERDHRRAVQDLGSVTARYPGFVLAHMFLGWSFEAQGHARKGIEALRKAVDLSARSAETRAALAYALGRHGLVDDARLLYRGLQAEPFVSPTQLALAHIGLGEFDAALDQLQLAIDARATDVIWVGVRPVFDPLRSSPRFTALLDRLGLRQPDAVSA